MPIPAPRQPAARAVALALCALLCAGCGVRAERLRSPALTRFPIILPAAPGASEAVLLYVADKHLADQSGLLVTLRAASSGAQALGELTAGHAKMALASQSEVLALRDRGTAVVAVAALDQRGSDAPVLVVRLREAERDGEDIRAFLQALVRADAQVRGDPAAAAALLAQARPQLLPLRPAAARARAQARLAAEIAGAATPASGEPYGYQDPASWSSLAQAMFDRGQLHTDPTTLAPPYTDEYLPGQGI
ncbi:MAG TPA: ABC transporter substrate-binding protein [Solirubrobacteraceae bacterium]|nr:ABC transporter substrate-binding protein [Solirubrobacteraceae bacterium]